MWTNVSVRRCIASLVELQSVGTENARLSSSVGVALRSGVG